MVTTAHHEDAATGAGSSTSMVAATPKRRRSKVGLKADTIPVLAIAAKRARTEESRRQMWL
jgi:hypothetical protein